MNSNGLRGAIVIMALAMAVLINVIIYMFSHGVTTYLIVPVMIVGVLWSIQIIVGQILLTKGQVNERV